VETSSSNLQLRNPRPKPHRIAAAQAGPPHAKALSFSFHLFFPRIRTYSLTWAATAWGLVGADEPRYAQIAHEMLDRFDSAHTLKDKLRACVTPYLYGIPGWKSRRFTTGAPCSSFRTSACTTGAPGCLPPPSPLSWIGLIYLHMRRFRPGGHLDAALITVACAGVIGFSRGASTDMQMAAPLAIGLLGWYAWYETDSKFWLYDIYFFTGLATLAKGPVAPFLALCIIAAFAFLRREWSILRRSFWWPGIALYFAMVLPWFIAVQLQNPTFFREFFSSTTWSALPPTAISTSSPSGTTWLSSSWP
jgi:4-amino-4-deoxy-L-arabinose transferase-like glycosyltransferase